MGKIKEHFHEQICNGTFFQDDFDSEASYFSFIRKEAERLNVKISDEITEEDIEKVNEAIEISYIEEAAEKAEFMKIYDLTKTYPM